MARAGAEWVEQFGIRVVRNITGADLVAESILAMSAKRKHTARDYGLLGVAMVRLGVGIAATGMAINTGMSIAQNLLH